ncbi:MAG: L-threonylcarbamoyladenylate synthase [Candidatus Eremiobacteraeota bacterium]|nr:L-threonylcarbamoyladenylate synthase [Candidatus Eremiobacteraeota bacterium]
MIVELDPLNPLQKTIKKVVELLKNGGIIAYPTDTIYGMGCDLFNKASIEKVYQIKKMPRYKPLSIICNDLKDISIYAQVSNSAYKIMKKLIPGPYTFVLPATRVVPKIMLTKRRTIGIRVPDNLICLSIVRELGSPIISTSASVTAQEIMSDPGEIEEKFGHMLDMVIDGGVLVSEPSSMLDLTEEVPKVVREGKGDVSMFM